MAHDVLGALGAAHAAGVVHRDVKPANILIAADGRAKVADFGIAKALEEAPSDLTGANQLLGTVAYLAPERLDGLPATARSDLYAFGVVLYEALAGVRAFHGTTPLSVAYAVHNADPPPLGEVRPDLRADLVAIVERAMARDPATRYATAAEMAAALETASAVVGTAADSTVAMASPAPESATVVMPIAADPGAGTASSNEASAWSKPLWAGGLVARLGRRTLLIALLIAGLVLIGVVALAAGGDSGRSSGTDSTPTTTVPPQAPTTEVTPTTPATTAAPAAGPPAGGGSPGKTKGRGKGNG